MTIVASAQLRRAVLAAALAVPLPALAEGGVFDVVTNLPWYAKLGIAIVLFFILAAFLQQLIVTMAAEAVRGVISSIMNALLRSEDKTGLGANPVIVFQSPPAMPPTEHDKRRDLINRLRDLRERDPNFSVVHFQDLASTAFLRFHQALASKDPAPVRTLVSPPMHQRLEREIQELKRLRRSRLSDGLRVDSAEITDYAHDGPYDYLTVRIAAAGARYTKDDQTGEIVEGGRDPASFAEKWTFLRRDTVKTPEGGDQPVISKCPSCGAPLAINAVGRCDYCDSEVTTGTFTWVLAESAPLAAKDQRQKDDGPRVIGQVKCPRCGKMVDDLEGVTMERCPRCGGMVSAAG